MALVITAMVNTISNLFRSRVRVMSKPMVPTIRSEKKMITGAEVRLMGKLVFNEFAVDV